MTSFTDFFEYVFYHYDYHLYTLAFVILLSGFIAVLQIFKAWGR